MYITQRGFPFTRNARHARVDEGWRDDAAHAHAAVCFETNLTPLSLLIPGLGSNLVTIPRAAGKLRFSTSWMRGGSASLFHTTYKGDA